jgi:hypothetical protein
MGGIGSFDSNPATAGGNGTSNKGGGGGGGGIGYVRANMALTGAIVVSPIADIGP